MGRYWCVCVLLLCVAVLVPCLAGAEHGGAAVRHISGLPQFYELLQEKPFVAVAFVANYCPHSKALKPEWAHAAELAQDANITLAQVEVTHPENAELQKLHSITTLPTIKIFRRDQPLKPQEYVGPRDARGILAHLRQQALPAVTVKSDAAEVEAFFGSSDVAVLGYFADTDGDAFHAFQGLAEENRADAAYAYVTDASLVASCGVDAADICEPPLLTLRSKRGAEGATYDGVFGGPALTRWLKVHTTPPVVSFRPESMQEFKSAWEAKLHKVVLAMAKDDDVLLEAARDAAHANDDLKFVAVTPEHGKKLLVHLGIDDGDLPAILAFEYDTNRKYLRTHVRPTDFPQFVKEFKDGVLPRFLKSAAPPEDNDDLVRILTASSFEKEVLGSGRATLLLLHTPHCPHCKAMMPAWEALARAFTDDTEVVVAKMDMEDNDMPYPAVPLASFPAIFFIDRDGNVTEHRGDRDFGSLQNFLLNQLGRGATAEEDEEDDLQGKEEEADQGEEGKEDYVQNEEEAEEAEEGEEEHDEL